MKRAASTLAALRSSKKADHLRATVTGERKGGKLAVRTLVLPEGTEPARRFIPAIAGERAGRRRAGVSPATALAAGLKVDGGAALRRRRR